MKSAFPIVALALVAAVVCAVPCRGGLLYEGTFLSYDIGPSPQWITVDDVDQDGTSDVVTTDNAAGVFASYGLGDGTLGPPQPLIAENGISQAHVVQLGPDDVPDLVAALPLSGALLVARGEGGGIFAPPISYEVGYGCWQVTVADFDHNGRGDLATVNENDNTVSVLLGFGRGFTRQADVRTLRRPIGISSGDFDGDGDVDLLVRSAFADSIQVLTNVGQGSFVPGAGIYVRSPQDVAIDDLDNDSNLDLAFTNFAGVHVHRGQGDGTFIEAPPMFTGVSPFSVTTADLDGDGHRDLAVTHLSDYGVTVLRGFGGGAWGPPLQSGAGIYPVRSAAGHFDADGVLDLVVANAVSGTLSLLHGNGDGTFGGRTITPTTPYPTAVGLADFDRDGALDLAVAGGYNVVTLHSGQENGLFAAPTYAESGFDPLSLAIADLNRDGLPDVITANRTSHDVSALIGRGDGTFDPPRLTATAHDPVYVTVADLNEDSIPDAAVSGPHSDSLTVLLGVGDGTFDRHIDYAGVGGRRMVAADFNGDHHVDLAVGAGALVVLFGHGDGTFEDPLFMSYATMWLDAGDVDSDGDVDLVVAGGLLGLVETLIGDGNGSFSSYGDCATGRSLTGLSLADVDLDGHLDLLAAASAINAVSILRGRGDGLFEDRVDYGAGYQPGPFAIGDLNGDALPDLVVPNLDAGRVTALLHRPGDPTPALVSPVSGVFAGGRVKLTWYAAGAPAGWTVERGEGGSWVVVGSTTSDIAGYLRFEDDHVVAGRRYGYRLRSGRGELVAGSEIWVVCGRLGLSFESIQPAPDRGSWQVTCSLTSGVPATIELIDVQGRRIARWSETPVTDGRQAIRIGGRVRPAAGMVFATLSQGGASVTRKVAVLF